MPNTIFSIPIERGFFCFFPHHVVVTRVSSRSIDSLRQIKIFAERNDFQIGETVTNGTQQSAISQQRSARARVCGRLSAREESALRLKNLFAALFFPPPPSLSLSLYFVFRFLSSLFLLSFRLRRPLTAISVLPSWRTFFCRPTIITRDFSRFHPPPDRYLARQ